MLAAQTEQTSLKKKPYKTTNKAIGDASPKKVDIPSGVERSMLPNMRTKPIKRPIQPKVRAELPKKFTVSWLNLPLLIARAEKKAPPATIKSDGISINGSIRPPEITAKKIKPTKPIIPTNKCMLKPFLFFMY